MSRNNLKIAKRLVALARELAGGARSVKADVRKPEDIAKFWQLFKQTSNDPNGYQSLQTHVLDYFKYDSSNPVIQNLIAYQVFLAKKNDRIKSLEEVAKKAGGALKPNSKSEYVFLRDYYTNLNAFVQLGFTPGPDPQIDKPGLFDVGMHSAYNEDLQDWDWDPNLQIFVPSANRFKPKSQPSNSSLPNSMLSANGIMKQVEVFISMTLKRLGVTRGSINPKEYLVLYDQQLGALSGRIAAAFNTRRTVTMRHEAELQAAMLGGGTYNQQKRFSQQEAQVSFTTISGILLDVDGRIIGQVDTVDSDMEVVYDNAEAVSDAYDKAKQLEATNPNIFRHNHPNGIEMEDDPTQLRKGSAAARMAAMRRQAGLLDDAKEKLMSVAKKALNVISPIVKKVEGIWNSVMSVFKSNEQKLNDACDDVSKKQAEMEAAILQGIKELNARIQGVSRVLDKIESGPTDAELEGKA